MIVWNYRGAAGKDFFRFRKYYIDIYKPKLYAIMETRCDPVKLQTPLQKMGFHKFILVENTGYAGGIIVACTEDNLKIELIRKRDQSIHMQVANDRGQEWLFTVVYASPNEILRKQLWENMRMVAATMVISWLVAGDFNDIAYTNEKKGGGHVSTRKCSTFRNNMEACNLSDLRARGSSYTWRGPIYHSGQHIYERLDRDISNEDWRLMFTEAQVKVLTSVDFFIITRS
ncbi:uncharacterized protein LOC131658903 [Vicia villosa]|uniref:uncharacterized protein LOC131658903 n=1 Tax=Vicia villosa TaxID=3911 RepID=UPI00273C8327|nr:uncharacterized protein LOC131658903 [Vicia villosa]